MQQHSTNPNRKYLTEDDSILFALDAEEERKQSDNGTFFEHSSQSPLDFPFKDKIITIEECMAGEADRSNRKYTDPLVENMFKQKAMRSQDKRRSLADKQNEISNGPNTRSEFINAENIVSSPFDINEKSRKINKNAILTEKQKEEEFKLEELAFRRKRTLIKSKARLNKFRSSILSLEDIDAPVKRRKSKKPAIDPSHILQQVDEDNSEINIFDETKEKEIE